MTEHIMPFYLMLFIESNILSGSHIVILELIMRISL
jgi:hypothetical protein